MKRFLRILIYLGVFICLAFALALTSFAAESLVTTDRVNFRTGPSLDADVIATLNAGASVEVLEHDPAGWSRVRVNGADGYIRSDFLTVPPDTQSMVFKTTDGVNFRRGPSLDDEILAALPFGTEVEVLEHDPAGWSKVRVNGTVGYIRSDFLAVPNADGTISAGSTSSAGRTSSSGSTGGSGGAIMRTNDGVNLRAGPSTDSDIIRVLNVNSAVQVLEHRTNGWSRVVHEGTTGYIRSDFLSVNGRYVELLDWSVVRSMIRYGEDIPVYDVRTGLSFNIRCFSAGVHADVEPSTRADMEIHLQTHNGVRSWSARPVWVTIGGHTIAASLHGMPHDVGTIPDNGMNGHICLHFLGSTAGNSAESYKRDLQNAVQEAWNSR